MKRWRRLEEHIDNAGWVGQSFNAAALGQGLNVQVPEASLIIQSHLDAQRRPGSRTKYVLYRTGRTRAAMWQVATRAAEVRAMGQQHLDDMRLRVFRALEPDMIRLGILHPRAAATANAITNAVDAAIQMLVSTMP